MPTNANIKAVITAEDHASKVLKDFSGHVENMGHKVAAAAKVAAVAMVAAGSAASLFALKSAADFEQTRIGLENMLGSADKARVLLKDISKFAAETPFEFPELAQAARQLVAFGFSAEDAFKTMKQLGNVSAAVGAPINDLAYLMGTLRAQGRAFTIDIRQFAMRGIPIYEYLGKVLKKNTQQITEMIEAGEIGFPEVQKAFEALAGEGGKWGNTMERQSKSINGLFSTLKDTLSQVGREMVGISQEGDIKEGSIMARMRDTLKWLNANLPDVIKKIGNFGSNLRNAAMPILIQWIRNLREVAAAIADYLEPKLKDLWHALQDELAPAFMRLWRDILLPLVPLIGAVLVGAVGALIDAFKILISVVAEIFTWIANNRQTFVDFSNNVAEVARQVAEYLTPKLKELGRTIRDELWPVLQRLWKEVLAPLIPIIGTVLVFAIGLLISTLSNLISVISQVLSWGISLFTFWTKSFPEGISTAVNWTRQKVAEFKAIWGELPGWLQGVLGGIAWIITSPFQSAYNTIRNIVNNIKNAVGEVKEAINSVGNASAKSTLKTFVNVLSGLPGLALGGPVSAGKAYIVGEKGPELFEPNQNGRIINNRDLVKTTTRPQASNNQTINITVQAGAFMGTQQDARKYALMIMEAYNDAMGARGMAT